MKNKFKIEMVYEEYPVDYPPFLLFLNYILKKNIFNIGVSVFKYIEGTPKKVYVMPNYYLRYFLQNFIFIFRTNKKFRFPLIYWINKKPNIIHVQNSFLYGHILEILKNKEVNQPKIIISLVGGETYIKPWVNNNWVSFYKNFGNLVDAYTVQSYHQKEYIQKWGIKAEKVYVIPVSFGEKSEAKPKFPNENCMKIVSAYRMTWEKNLEGSIRLAKILKEKNINFLYTIYGDGNDLGELYYLVDKYNLKDYVKIMGNIDNKILKEKLSEFDFFVQLSISEALSASVIEAQSFGIPCLVSDSGGIKEAIIPDKTGFSAPYYDLEYFVNQMIMLWNDKNKYFQFSKEAIKHVNQNYSLEVEFERTKKMYEQVLNK